MIGAHARRKSDDATIAEKKELELRNEAAGPEGTNDQIRRDRIQIVFEMEHQSVDKRRWAHILAITYEGERWSEDCLANDIGRLDVHPTWDELKKFDLRPSSYYDRGPLYETEMVDRLFPPRPQPYKWMRSIQHLKVVTDAIKNTREYGDLWDEIWTEFTDLLPGLMELEAEMLEDTLIRYKDMPQETPRSEWSRWSRGLCGPWESHALVYVNRRELMKMKALTTLDSSSP